MKLGVAVFDKRNPDRVGVLISWGKSQAIMLVNGRRVRFHKRYAEPRCWLAVYSGKAARNFH